METKFKRHQKIKLLVDPDSEFIEYHNPEHEEKLEEELEEHKKMLKISKGMSGKINILLPNGQYHVEVHDKKGKIIAYCVMNEEDLEAID